MDHMEGWTETNSKHSQNGYNSSSNSNSSSISSSSSDSVHKSNIGPNELEADADSLTCRQSGLSSNDLLENDGRKLVCNLPAWTMLLLLIYPVVLWSSADVTWRKLIMLYMRISTRLHICHFVTRIFINAFRKVIFSQYLHTRYFVILHISK